MELQALKNPKDLRNFTTCFHISEVGKCQLYNCKFCRDVNHRKMSECAYQDKNKLNLADTASLRAFVTKLELFLGEKLVGADMDLNGRILKGVGKKTDRRKVLGRNPLEEQIV